MKATSMAAKAALLTLAGLLGACVPEYHPPTLAEPHAVIKIRRTYDTSAGTNLRELLLVDDHRAFAAEASARLASAPRIDASLVHPMPATFTMASSFFHHETRTLQETYYVQESYYTTESYDCSSGYGSNAVHRTCTRPSTQYRSVPRTRWVTKSVEVVDAQCQALNRFAPATNRVYLLQYSFQEGGACALSCFEQVANNDGSFQNLPCPPAPPPK